MENQNPMQGGGGQQPGQGFRREEEQSQAPEQGQPQGGNQMGDNQQQADQGNQQQGEQQASSGQPVCQDGNEKIWGIIGYIIPILFFVPLVMDDLKNNPYSKFHANQQLNFLLFLVIGYIVSSVLMLVLIGFLLYFLVLIGNVVFLVLGIINAAQGKQKPLPLIGGIEIIK